MNCCEIRIKLEYIDNRTKKYLYKVPYHFSVSNDNNICLSLYIYIQLDRAKQLFFTKVLTTESSDDSVPAKTSCIFTPSLLLVMKSFPSLTLLTV